MLTATGSSGVYANRSYITARPTLIPRYYGGFGAYGRERWRSGVLRTEYPPTHLSKPM
jgi:hypothetical protein